MDHDDSTEAPGEEPVPTAVDPGFPPPTDGVSVVAPPPFPPAALFPPEPMSPSNEAEASGQAPGSDTHASLEPESTMSGAFERFSIGDPGAAPSKTVAKFDAQFPEVADIQAHGSVVLDAADVPGLSVRAVTLSGLSHRYYGNARQDSYALARSQDGRYFVAAVADGLGSAPLSHEASSTASRVAADAVANLLVNGEPDQIDWQGVMKVASDAILRQGVTVSDTRVGARPELQRAVFDGVLKQMCTTLVMAVVPVAAGVDGRRRALVVRVGDSSAWVLDPSDGFVATGSVKNEGADIAGSGTDALPALLPATLDVAEVDLAPEQAVVLMSDGVGDPLGNGSGEVGEVLGRWWARPPELIEFIGQVDFGRRSFDDDRTVVAVWPIAAT